MSSNKQILLIGNGPSVLEHEFGKIIDEQPLVCRFNAFILKGYEKYVGTKCDIWVSCTGEEHVREKCDIFDKIYFPLSQPRYIDRAKRFKNVECIPHSVYLKASMMLGEYFYPSSGLLASIFFIDNEYDVLLHGFDFFQKEKHHYCDNNIIGTNHRPHMEKKHLIFY